MPLSGSSVEAQRATSPNWNPATDEPKTSARARPSHGRAVAIAVCVAALCYLGAAALDRPWVAWAGIVGGSLVVVASELVSLVWGLGAGVGWGGIGMIQGW